MTVCYHPPGHPSNLSFASTPADAAACLSALPDVVQRPRIPGGGVHPLWGLSEAVVGHLPLSLLTRLEAIVHLRDRGDQPRPEKTLIRLDRDHWFTVAGRAVRAIKLKGIGRHLAPVVHGTARHVRVMGRGDIPKLVPYLDADGTQRFIPYDVGEPWGAKRFRSALNEWTLTGYAFAHGLAVQVPIGIGLYQDPGLLYKGEAVGFSLWGLESPDDTRFDALWRERFTLDTQRLAEAARDEPSRARDVVIESLAWTRRHLAAIVAETRRYHDLGLVHHEPQFDNHAFHRDRVCVVDWEEGAHARCLSRLQFLESALIDLFKVVCYCCVLEQEHRAVAESHRVPAPPGGFVTNWFTVYFGRLDDPVRDALAALLPIGLRDRHKLGPFRDAVYPLLAAAFDGLAFGSGIDWADVARPHRDGFSAEAPRWQPEASTAFDPRLFVRKGDRGNPDAPTAAPTPAIEDAETAVRDGRFADAAGLYQALLTGMPDDHPHRPLLCHTLAALLLVLRRDEAARHWFLAAGLAG